MNIDPEKVSGEAFASPLVYFMGDSII